MRWFEFISESTDVEAYGYIYDRRDQRVMWRKIFSSEQSAHAWADSRNATIIGIRPVQQESQLDELSFHGSQCTKDCSGHRAGYEWSQRQGGVDAASWSPSFNKGAWLFKNGY